MKNIQWSPDADKLALAMVEFGVDECCLSVWV